MSANDPKRTFETFSGLIKRLEMPLPPVNGRGQSPPSGSSINGAIPVPTCERGPSDACLRTATLEYEAGPCVGAQQLDWHFGLCQFVEHLARTVQRDNVIDVHLLECCDRLAHVI